MLPATFSNAILDYRAIQSRLGLAYEAYLTNGFNDFIINNAENKTFCLQLRRSDRFDESFNGSPLFTER
jgi:hypothetical protein